MTKKTIVGELFHEIEIFGNKEYAHVGFRDKDNNFGDMIVSIVPEIGMKRKAKLTIELLNETEDDTNK